MSKRYVTAGKLDKLWKGALSLFVQKVDGKGLSSNDYTNAEKEKLAGLSEDAEKNIINSVKVNGTPTTVAADGSVNVIVPDAPIQSIKVNNVEVAPVKGTVNITIPEPGEPVNIEEATDEDIQAIIDGTYKE